MPLISANVGTVGWCEGETGVFIPGLEYTKAAASPLSPHVVVSKQLFNLPLAWERASIHPQPMGWLGSSQKGPWGDQICSLIPSHSWTKDLRNFSDLHIFRKPPPRDL